MSCDSPSLVWEPVPPGGTVKCEVNLLGFLANWHRKGAYYGLTAAVRVRGVAGFEYVCTGAGETGDKPIIWPRTVGATVDDGSAEWTCAAASSASLSATVSGTPTWAVPSGYTASGAAISNNVASALIEVPASANGDDAVVTVSATLSDTQVWPFQIILPVRIPQRTCAC